jgi:hypothetical protein
MAAAMSSAIILRLLFSMKITHVPLLDARLLYSLRSRLNWRFLIYDIIVIRIVPVLESIREFPVALDTSERR